MEILGFETDYLSSNSYIIEQDRHAIMIDPCEMDTIKEFIDDRQLLIDHVILTHEHADHITGVKWVQKTFGPIVMCSTKCAEHLQNARKNQSYYFELFRSVMTRIKQKKEITLLPFVCNADESFDGEHFFEWMGHSIYMRTTPGHSAGSICILIDDHFLFSGDTLMDDDKSVTSFVGGDYKKMMEITVPWLQSLKKDTFVYPGHYNSFILGDRLKRDVY